MLGEEIMINITLIIAKGFPLAIPSITIYCDNYVIKSRSNGEI